MRHERMRDAGISWAGSRLAIDAQADLYLSDLLSGMIQVMGERGYLL